MPRIATVVPELISPIQFTITLKTSAAAVQTLVWPCHIFQWNNEFACFLVLRTYVALFCTPSETRQCRYGPVQSDRFLLYADRIISGVSGSTSCQAACDSERNFRCRSYSIHSATAVPSSSPGASMMYCSLSSSTTPTYEVNIHFSRFILFPEFPVCYI